MSMKTWVIDLFKDERRAASIKPVVAFIGALFLCIATILSMYTKGDVKPSDALVNAILVVTCVGLGSDSVDKFSYKPQAPVEAPKTEEPKPEEPGA